MSEISRRGFMGVAMGAGAAWALGPRGACAEAAAVAITRPSAGTVAQAMRLGRACHAFDHLGAYGMQAEAAAASGATVIYATGVGGDGYEGLPPADQWSARQDAARAYTEKAKSLGIPVVLGYLCATSIVGLDDFDANWTPEFRAKFGTPPREWLQRGLDGTALPSWYGGEYQPACMNHPDWRQYEKEMVRFQIETGHGGIFFDNPTVHPKGCYCDHCMQRFRSFLEEERPGHHPQSLSPREGSDLEEGECPEGIVEALPTAPDALRALAESRRDDFRRFRTTIARDFLAEMRSFARTLDSNALITANNSTNAPTVLYSQCNLYGYSPYEMSRAEDFVVIEDMSSQPRMTDDGKVFEYGPTYKQLKALCHGKPLVVCTIAEADYHTPPNLVRLAMAEAAANQATYLLWSTWPEEHRARMSATARRQVDFLREYAYTYENVSPRNECGLFLPAEGWLRGDTCRASDLAAKLSRANVQYTVFTEETFGQHLRDQNLVIESDAALNPGIVRTLSQHGRAVWRADVNPNWLDYVLDGDPPRAVKVENAPNVRAYVFDSDDRTFVHLLNLDVRKRSSFDDEIFPARDFLVHVRISLAERTGARTTARARKVTAEIYTADDNTTRGTIAAVGDRNNEFVVVQVPVLEVAAILAITLG